MCRTVHIEGIGDVTMKGAPIRVLRRRYPRTPEEYARLVADLAASEASGRASATAFTGAAAVREIAGQSVSPKLTETQVKLLPAVDQWRLGRAILEAHPETRAVQEAVA
jgi:hypothetical protein